MLGGAVALGKSGLGPDVNLWWYGGSACGDTWLRAVVHDGGLRPDVRGGRAVEKYGTGCKETYIAKGRRDIR